MEQNPPTVVKKVWSLMRAIFFMLKKGISKAKPFTDLNMLMKRGQLAGKSLHNLLFRHHHNWVAATFHRHPHHLPFPTPPSGEYEFSCSDTPPYLLSLFSSHKKNLNKQHTRDVNNEINKHIQYNPVTDKVRDGCDGCKPDLSNNILINATVMKALENMLTSAVASPGFVNSPVVKQLRITDSPFPLSNGDEDCKVDEDADKFIMRFYNDLRRQIKAK